MSSRRNEVNSFIRESLVRQPGLGAGAGAGAVVGVEVGVEVGTWQDRARDGTAPTA
jgi:hypothetical protein